MMLNFYDRLFFSRSIDPTLKVFCSIIDYSVDRVPANDEAQIPFTLRFSSNPFFEELRRIFASSRKNLDYAYYGYFRTRHAIG